MKTTSLFYCNVVCPICNTDNKFEVIRKGAYSVSELDTDFMPLGIKWTDSRFEGINPLLYFIATCPVCSYSTELNDKFKEWQKDNHFRNYRLGPLKEKHHEILGNENGVIKKIVAVLDPRAYPNETAVCKLILAVLDESLGAHPSHLTLARYYLRLGWLLRDLKCEKPSQEEGKLVELIKMLEDHLQLINKDITNLCQSTKALASFYHQNANELFSSSLNQYFELLNNILASTADAREQISRLKTLNMGLLTDRSEGKSARPMYFKSYHDFGTFLQAIQNIMPNAPTNEIESLKLSKDFYKQSLDIGRELKDGPQSFQAFYLIGELAYRIGDYNEAIIYFNSTINKGRVFINDRNNSDCEIAKVKPIVDRALFQARKVMEKEKSAQPVA
ncbi:MAG: hypothetical protein CO189_09555 [candidate division Zixibacteria bacterium CG_4_9_14_3_um_filter_46_8]|nr:MAG: hypothetical protein CO189_09555 [candidate division Zixibacteria bacterium CG_4_9_14_3_um_filter_46_8]